MKDLTHGPIARHVVARAIPIAAGMLLQTLYFFVDLYFVSRLGQAAIAGVSSAGTLMFLVFALTQMLGVGTTAMVSHAVGRKDPAQANHVFNQAVGLAAVCTVATLLGGYALAHAFMRGLAADEATVAAGVTFLQWLVPGMAAQFALIVMGSALRGTGIVKPGMVVQMLTVVLNALFAPMLIAGWGTGHPLGVAGAGLATTLATLIGLAVLVGYFVKLEHYVGFDRHQWRPRVRTWLELLNIGLPAGGEFALLGVFTAIMYWATRELGGAAQAGLGIGGRIMQMTFLPAMAVAFAAAPIAGQNFGARNAPRVRETFRVACTYGVVAMALLTLLVQWDAERLARIFSEQPDIVAAAAQFLRYLSWNFVAIGVIFTCSAIFQGMGNTWPSLGSMAVRLVTFAVPAVWIAQRPGFELRHVLLLSIASTLVQAFVSVGWLRVEFRRRLGPLAAQASFAPEEAQSAEA
jgi:putative MATE family efflux protein